MNKKITKSTELTFFGNCCHFHRPNVFSVLSLIVEFSIDHCGVVSNFIQFFLDRTLKSRARIGVHRLSVTFIFELEK